jgi:putative transposase
MDKIFADRRKNYMETGQIYFWTATINKWQKLLEENMFKHIILSSFEHLSKFKKLDIFAFVIMPNHISYYLENK